MIVKSQLIFLTQFLFFALIAPGAGAGVPSLGKGKRGF